MLLPLLSKQFTVNDITAKMAAKTTCLVFLPVLAVQRFPLLLWRPLTIIRKRRGKFLPISWTYAKHLTQCGLMDCFENCSQSQKSREKCLL